MIEESESLNLCIIDASNNASRKKYPINPGSTVFRGVKAVSVQHRVHVTVNKAQTRLAVAGGLI